jgi:hypothetical protein
MGLAFRAANRGDYEGLADDMRKAMDAYAHELAESIRNSKELRDFTDDHMSDCNAAADFIDPEVSNG